jgi:hypothetical protein
MDINWIDIFTAALRVLVVGALFGAGLPALFAVGLRLQAAGDADEQGVRRPGRTAAAYALFGIVVAAVLVGVLWITRHSLDHYFGISLFGA